MKPLERAWAYAFGGVAGTAKIRSSSDDFMVEELLGFDLSGEGEHIYLQIQKSEENTEYIARQLAKFANLPSRAVSYAGLKDRHALTTQWFSVHLPGKKELAWNSFETSSIKILSSKRHLKKLKKGALKGNRFFLILRNWQGDCSQANTIMESIQSSGIPNYFGEQRFGIDYNNLERAKELFSGKKFSNRHKRGLYISAARSFLFNHILSQRVTENTWNQAISGDLMMFDQSNSYFKADEIDDSIKQRVQAKQIHPSGPLWGKGSPESSLAAFDIEQQIADRYDVFSNGLEQIEAAPAQRPLRVNVENFCWEWLSNTEFKLSFTLPAGSYATCVLREFIDY